MINLYRDRPDLYDLLHDDETGDEVLYAGLLGSRVLNGAHALELGCGSGRVLEMLLHEGCTVTGLDSEEAMLARARERLAPFGRRVSLEAGDMRDFDLAGDRFDLIVVAVNTFMHLASHAEQLACLHAIRRHVRDDGAVVLDLANPFHAIALPQGVVTLRRQTVLPDGHEVTVTGVLEVDPAYPRVVDHLFFDEAAPDGALRRHSAHVELRIVFMPELELLLAASGLGIADAYGDYELGPYTAASERMVAIVGARL